MSNASQSEGSAPPVDGDGRRQDFRWAATGGGAAALIGFGAIRGLVDLGQNPAQSTLVVTDPPSDRSRHVDE